MTENISYKYIFARYKEDISWFSNDNEIMENAIIYNKGEPLNIENEIFLKNVGRDPGSFFQFIVDYYDNLPDICIFSQGKINDHYIYGKPGNVETLKRLKKDAIEFGESPAVFIENDPAWCNDWNFKLNCVPGFNPKRYKNNNVISCIDWINIHVDSNVKNINLFHTNCIFSVSKQKILLRSKDYYKNLLELVNWSSLCFEQTFIERALYYIFNPTPFNMV